MSLKEPPNWLSLSCDLSNMSKKSVQWIQSVSLFLSFQTDSIMFRSKLTICCCSLFYLLTKTFTTSSFDCSLKESPPSLSISRKHLCHICPLSPQKPSVFSAHAFLTWNFNLAFKHYVFLLVISKPYKQPISPFELMNRPSVNHLHTYCDDLPIGFTVNSFCGVKLALYWHLAI